MMVAALTDVSTRAEEAVPSGLRQKLRKATLRHIDASTRGSPVLISPALAAIAASWKQVQPRCCRLKPRSKGPMLPASLPTGGSVRAMPPLHPISLASAVSPDRFAMSNR